MKRAVWSLLACVGSLSAVASAQPAAPPAFTAQMGRAIDRIAQNELRAHTTPGLAIGVVEDGLLLYAKGYGSANLRTRTRVAPATQFYVGSVSKEFAAAAVLLLAQDKKLALGDRVTKFVPELRVARDVTIGQLLQQTSGLPKLALDPTKPTTIDAVVKTLDGLHPSSAPGTKFEYNDANYAIAALIVGRASGLPYSVFLQTRIFQPLVMTSSLVAGDLGVSPQHADGYSETRGKFVQTKLWNAGWLFGANDLVSNVYDLAKWDIGFPLLLNVESVSTMWTASGLPGETAYGMGWVLDERGGKRYIWSNGEIAGFHSMNALLPDDHVAVIVLANTDSLHGTGAVQPERVASQILDVVEPLPPPSFQSALVERAKEWVGRLQRSAPDRTQLTPQFNDYLSDQLIAKTNLHALGDLQSLTPVENFQRGGDTVYVFLARFAKETLRYEFVLTPQGKIDGLSFK